MAAVTRMCHAQRLKKVVIIGTIAPLGDGVRVFRRPCLS